MNEYRQRHVTWWTQMFAALVIAFAAFPARASDFYAGQQIRIIVASGPAGGFDTYARLLARHMGRFIPGNPTFVVQNMPGAGGLQAAGYMAKIAPKDGLTIGALQAGTIKAPMLGQATVDFDHSKFGWIGSLNSEVMVCVSSQGSKVKSLPDAMTEELVVGAAGAANDSALLPVSLNSLLGTKFKVIPGYADGPGILLAMQRGEVGGRCGWSWSSIMVQHPDWVRNKTINVLLQVPVKHADLAHVPLASEVAKTPEDRQAIEFLFGHLQMSRAFVLPPGTPPERLSMLRAAFDAMVKDESVMADFNKINQELSPLSGTEVEALVNKLSATPPPVIARAKAAVGIVAK
ncbi:MAG: tripartite tricarboxylate transporter family receptor [Hyphomicrobiales bacterium]|nr:tripartite tricarboxylate transporter family receptor [Hyphomicrobiales bacterium]